LRLLIKLITLASPLGPTLIPGLDEHLDKTRPAFSCKRGDVIEVQGPAASGKSHLFYYLLINCILPPSYSSQIFNGWGKAAILLDADHKFNIQRFDQLLRSRLRRLLPGNTSMIEAVTTEALGRLHVFRPTSSHQLAATVQHLPMYLATNLPEEDLGILAVDSITAFYWPDRYILEEARAGNLTRPITRSQSPLNLALAALHSFARSHGPLILLSTWDLGPTSKIESRRRPRSSAPVIHPDTDKLERHPLPVSCHISLITSNLIVTEDEAERRDNLSAIVQNATTRLLGIVGFPREPTATRFMLHITADDIVT
ncbi:DNA repair protein XRCC2, partial [Leucoagaricus sp. SymC.cos]